MEKQLEIEAVIGFKGSRGSRRGRGGRPAAAPGQRRDGLRRLRRQERRDHGDKKGEPDGIAREPGRLSDESVDAGPQHAAEAIERKLKWTDRPPQRGLGSVGIMKIGAHH